MKRLLLMSLLAVVFSNANSQDSFSMACFRVAEDLYKAVNLKFQDNYLAETKRTLNIKLTAEAPAKVVKAIKNGFQPELVALIQDLDVDDLAKSGYLNQNWRDYYPQQSSPYYSTIAFLVRADNPKNIKNWNNLIQSGTSYLIPNPLTQRFGRFGVMAALMFAKANLNTNEEQESFMREFANHQATTTEGGKKMILEFIKNKSIDALVVPESQALSFQKDYPDENFIVVLPNPSILMNYPVVLVEKYGKDKDLLNKYLNYLYSDEIQELIADKFHYRVASKSIMKKHKTKFQNTELKEPSSLGDVIQITNEYFGKKGKWDNFLSE